MTDFVTETLTGWQDQPFALKWRIPQDAGAVAALILPGLRYTPDKPLLYYTAQALAQRGVAVAAAWLDYSQPAFQEAEPQTRLQWLLADAEAALQAVRRRPGVKQVLLVGKSIGTLTMGALWGVGGLADMAASIWFTPLLAFPAVQKAARYADSPRCSSPAPPTRRTTPKAGRPWKPTPTPKACCCPAATTAWKTPPTSPTPSPCTPKC